MSFEIAPALRPLVSAALLIAAAWPAAAATYPVRDLKTSIAVYPAAAESLGLEIRNVRGATTLAHHHLSVSDGRDMAFAGLQSLSLAAEIDRHVFERLAGGSVVHAGGFELGYRGGSVSLQGFVLAAGAEARSFEVRTAEGELIFTGNLAHFAVDRASGLVQVFNMTLRVAPPLAKRLGDSRLTGQAAGALALEVRASFGAEPEPEPREVAGGPPGCTDWSGEQDVALIQIASVGQTERQGGMVSLTPSAALKNVGTANVPWHAKFTGPNAPYGNDQHPFLVWQLYRLRNGVMEMMAFSDVKHAFLTLNFNCDQGACTQSNVLGIGCEDVYDEVTNESFDELSFRSELNAARGLWNSTGSHFDQDSDGSQDHPPGPPGDPFPTHRLAVQESQLDVAGERYFFEAWYVVRDDIDIFNTMGWREMNPNFSGGNWQFPLVTGLAHGSVLDSWVNPSSPDPLARNEVVAVNDGHVRLAVKTTDLGGGNWRYDYALMNHDFDPQIGVFEVPVTAGTTLSNITFRDIDAAAGNDWTSAQTGSSVRWSKPAAVEGLDWGRMYNFGFTANRQPAEVLSHLTAVEPTSPGQLSVSTLAPFDSSLFSDGFEAGNTGGWDAASP